MTLNVLVGDKSSSTRRAVKKAAACFISINTSAHIFISQYKSILYTILSLSSYYPSCSVISICPPHFLLSLSISSSFPVCVYVRGLHIMYRCLHPYRCVCVAIIEKISRQPTSLLPLSYSCRLCCFSSPFLLTPLIHHSSSLLTFYLFCRHLPSRASFPSYYSLFLPPSLAYLSLPPLCQLICFCGFIFLSMFFFHPVLPLYPLVYFGPFLAPLRSLPPCSFPSSPLSLSLSRVADLFLQLSLYFLLLFSPLSSRFYALVLSFPLFSPPPSHLFVHLLLSPPSYILPLSLIGSASIPSLWKSSPYLSLLSPPFLHRSWPSFACLFLNRIPPFSSCFSLYPPGPSFPLLTISLPLSSANTVLFVILPLLFIPGCQFLIPLPLSARLHIFRLPISIFSLFCNYFLLSVSLPFLYLISSCVEYMPVRVHINVPFA